MKALYLCFFLISVAIYCNGQTMVEECIAEIGINKDDPNPVIYSGDPNLKCMNACLARKKGAIVNGKMNVEKQFDILKRYYNGSLVFLKDAISACALIANKQRDECAMANLMRNCLTEKLKPSPIF